MTLLWAYLVIVGLVVAGIDARSDEFGRNPQHDFGSVVGRKLNPVLPFWTMLGDAFANEDFVRLTPDRQSKTGGVWNSQRMSWKSWEAMIQFNVNGVSQVGADGFAWWLAKEVNVIGDFFGFRERFNGIGVVIDTYDNDGSGQHPLVSLFKNDGTKTYAHSHDGGVHHASDMELGHCSYSLRNRKENTIMKITYDGSSIVIELRLESESDWTPCITAENVFVETGLYMGLTAATGHLADNHDVHGITVRNLDQDAKFFDSESRFAQFSKYTVAESLGRIQSDIRGALYATSAVGAKPVKGDAPASSVNNDVSRELADLKRELQNVVQGLQRQGAAPQQAAPVYANTNQRSDGGINERRIDELLAPLSSNAQEVKTVSADLKKGVSDLSGETRKLTQIQNKLELVIKSVEKKEKERVKAMDSRVPEESGSLFSIMNILFVLVCLVCAYLGFTLYRIKGGRSTTKFV
jgi:hypothetical protein